MFLSNQERLYSEQVAGDGVHCTGSWGCCTLYINMIGRKASVIGFKATRRGCTVYSEQERLRTTPLIVDMSSFLKIIHQATPRIKDWESRLLPVSLATGSRFSLTKISPISKPKLQRL